ncbi:MAG: hypothetical protein HQK49_09100 [Oligoflexia bacterium]|nr:hypothetical protein [Oligoflexia bacterium]
MEINNNSINCNNNNNRSDDELRSSVVHKNLDKKIKLAGFELLDVLSVLFLSSVMNLIFGRTSISFLMVFIVPLTVGVILHFGKKNKSENFILHFIRYYLIPGRYEAGERVNELRVKELRRKIYNGE